MNDKPKRKLILSRETITALQSDELLGVHGGISTPNTVSTSTTTNPPATGQSLCWPPPSRPTISFPNSISVKGGDGK